MKLYGDAKKYFPFSVECKNQEKWSIQKWVQQAKDNMMENTDWLLIVKKNRSYPIAIMDVDVFFALMNELIEYWKKDES